MSALLREGQELKRVLHVYGIEGPVVVALTNAGISFKAKGAKIPVGMTWTEAVDACKTPVECPSTLYGKPLEYLAKQAQKITERRVKRMDKKEAP